MSMAKPNESSDAQERRKKLEFQMLRSSLESDKKFVENFLEDAVYNPLMAKIQEMIRPILERAKELQRKGEERTPQEHYELRNIAQLTKRMGTLRNCQYWQLLQLLYKFPSQHQIAMDDTLVGFLKKSAHYQDMNRFIPTDRYVQNQWSFKRFLTDCIAFARLRRLQIKYMEETAPGQSPLEKAMLLEQEFAIIPDGILLERQISCHDYVHTYKGMDLAKNVPVVVKYLQDESVPVASRVRTIPYAEAKRRFEREAQAFDKLERHRQAKEQAAMMLAEQAKLQIADGERKGNQEKIKAGLALQRQGEELLCDRYFVKAYCLATGDLFHFHIGDTGFYRGASQQVAFMVMEYIEGTDLKTLLQEYHDKNLMVPMKVFIPIMEGILEALEYCHTEGIIHRDIRPENILITPNFKVRLTNLGRAKVEDMTQLTAKGAFVGTPGYAAPEGIISSLPANQIPKQGSLIEATDHRFDIYSLGCVAYEILTGRPVFASNKKNLQEQDDDLLQKHLRETPILPSQIRKDIPEPISLLILKMLAKKPDDRFSNARETLLTLRATLSFGQRAGEYTQRLIEQLRPAQQESAYPTKKSPFIVKVAAFLLIILILSLPFIYMFRVELDEFVKNAHQYILHEWHEFVRTDKEQCKQVQEILMKLEPEYKTIQAEWNEGNKNFNILKEEFKPTEGYLSYDEILPDLLAQSEPDIKKIGEAIAKAKDIVLTDGVSALEVIKPYQNYKQEHPELWLLVARLNKKINEVKQQNEEIREEQKLRENVLGKAYSIRNTLLESQERLMIVAERLQIRDEQYPMNDDDFPIPSKELIERVNNNRAKVQELSKIVQTINEFLQKDDLKQLDSEIQKYSGTPFGTVLADLQDDATSMHNILTICQDKQTKKEFATKTNQALKKLDDWMNAIDEQRKATKEVWTTSQTYIQPAIPLPALLATADNEYKKTFSRKTNLSSLQQKQDTAEAIVMSDKIIAEPTPKIIDELEILKQNLQGQIDIAIAEKKAKEEEKQNEERRKQILVWQNEANKQLRSLNQAIQDCQTEIDMLTKSYPQQYGNFVNAAKSQLQSASPKQIAITKLLQDVQNKIAQNQLATAHQLLNGRQKEWQELEAYTKVIQQHKNRLRQTYLALEQSKQSKIYEARCKRILENLAKYSQSVEFEVSSIERDIQKLKQDFQPNDQYPELQKLIGLDAQGKTSLSAFEIGKKIRDDLLNAKKGAQTALNAKNYNQAWQMLSKYEAKSPDGYTQFVSNLPKLRSELIILRRNCEIRKGNIGYLTKIEQYQNEIQIRRDNAEKYCTQIESIWIEMKRYPNVPPPEQKYKDLIQKARTEEIPDLEKAIEYSNRKVSEKNYTQAIKTLSSFSATEEPTTNFIVNALESYLKQCNKQLAILKSGGSIAISQSPTDNLESEARKNAPLWYQQAMQVKSQYDQLEKAIDRSRRSTASNYKLKNIANAWRDLSEYPEKIAELMRYEAKIKAKLGKVPVDDTTYRGKKVIAYLNTNPRNIDMNIDKELGILNQKIGDLRIQTQSSYLEEETIRDIEYTLRDINRKFENDTNYGPANDHLQSIAGQQQ